MLAWGNSYNTPCNCLKYYLIILFKMGCKFFCFTFLPVVSTNFVTPENKLPNWNASPPLPFNSSLGVSAFFSAPGPTGVLTSSSDLDSLVSLALSRANSSGSGAPMPVSRTVEMPWSLKLDNLSWGHNNTNTRKCIFKHQQTSMYWH